MGLIGNFIRSWQTDENFHDAKAKNRKANNIMQSAVAKMEAAKRDSEKELQRLYDLKMDAYNSLRDFAETFTAIDDVRFRESNIAKEGLCQIPPETLAMLKEFKFEASIVDTTSVSDGVGMLSMLLPVGIGSFGSFSSLQESRAALAEAEANVYEAKMTARQIDSAVLVTKAITERARLLADVLSGMYTLWFKKAVMEFVRLVDSKNSIKYYFLQRDGYSVYSDEEYSFIAALAALAKTVKTVIDVKLYTEEEEEAEEILENTAIDTLTNDIKKQISQDESFGLSKTYCAPLITGEISAVEFIRPGDGFTDDFEGTKQRLQQEGYMAVCDFEDYIKSKSTSDSTAVRNRYLQICDNLYADRLYCQLYEKVVEGEKNYKNGYGYKALSVFRQTLQEAGDVEYKAKLISYLDDKLKSYLEADDTIKKKQNNFDGMKEWFEFYRAEASGRKAERFAYFGKHLAENAKKEGYREIYFEKRIPERKPTYTATTKSNVQKKQETKTETAQILSFRNILAIALGLWLATAYADDIAWIFYFGERYLWIDTMIVNTVAIWVLMVMSIAIAAGNFNGRNFGKYYMIGTVAPLTILYTQYCRTFQEMKHYILASIAFGVGCFVLAVLCMLKEGKWKYSHFCGLLLSMIAYPILFLIYAFFALFLESSQGFWLVITSMIFVIWSYIMVGALKES